MPDNHLRALRSPSPIPGASVLPPLSKYYYGPAQGWTSADASPSHNGMRNESGCAPEPHANDGVVASTWSLNAPHEIPPTLPPRLSPSLQTFSPRQWTSNFPSQQDPDQGWQQHGPAPSAPPASQFTDSYALMHETSHAHVNPTWDSDSPRNSMDTSTWGVNYRQKHAQGTEPDLKPPLPVSQHAAFA